MHRTSSVLKRSCAGTLLLGLSSCGGGGNSGAPPVTVDPITNPGNSPSQSFYVTVDNDAFSPPQPSSVLQFSRTATGTVSPLGTLTGPAGVIFSSAVIDASGNLYVAGELPGGTSSLAAAEVLIYAPGASGTAAPAQTIQLPGLFNNSIAGMDVDTAGNLYISSYVAIGSGPSGRVYPGLSVYAYSAAGSKQSRVIAGDQTTILGDTEIAVDGPGNIYVAGGSYADGPQPILIFGPKATGNVAPDATIAGPNTTLYFIRGIATDVLGDIYVASLAQNTSGLGGPLSGIPSILEFAPGAIGNVAPIRTITGSATGMGEIGNLEVDSSGNIYVLDGSSIHKFAPDAKGNVAPAATITSSAFIESGGGIALH